MAENKEKKTLSLGNKKGTLSLKGKSSASAPTPSAKPGIAVEVRKRRTSSASDATKTAASDASDKGTGSSLTDQERQARLRALQQAQQNAGQRSKLPVHERARKEEPKEEEQPTTTTEESAQAEQPLAPAPKKYRPADDIATANLQAMEADAAQNKARQKSFSKPDAAKESEDDILERKRKADAAAKAKAGDKRRRPGKLTVTQVLNEDYERDRGPSLAAQRRAKEKERLKSNEPKENVKQVREIIVPETITVQELSNRMAERSGDVVKSLMKMGVMATINQTIDADTAELLVDEFGHKVKRVTDADIEIGVEGTEDTAAELKPRPPVVTIMGHVDHGKTSLLDAMRSTNVVSGEAGGITQHIGAYQVEAGEGKGKVTFIDTPGHAAFTQMRARGADITDIVILVVAANDSVMPQTIEAINHAKAANVPIIVAVNKIDLPDAEPYKVKQDLLQHEVITEDMGGDTMVVEVSAKQRIGLDDLLDTILLQAEVLELTANPDREAHGTVVESKMEKGRGSVATVLINKGTLRQGDIFVVGKEWGRVRTMIDDHGKQVKEAEPGKPVEVLGLTGTPDAGDMLDVVRDEAKARAIIDYRRRKQRDVKAAALGATSIEQMMAQSKESKGVKTLNVLIKADVHGSIEAIAGSLEKMTEENDEIAVRIIHSGVGGITETDVSLAKTSSALIVGFNVRANAQARDLAQKEDVAIRYHNIIYNVLDDAKDMLTGMLAPKIREELIGYAQIREVFNITKVGKVAGCMITDGIVKRGSKVRLLRDDVVIHEGMLKTLKRFKDEVKEAREGMECGMAFENYDDIKANDVIECFDIIEEKQTID